jgi:hypothetical protein
MCEVQEARRHHASTQEDSLFWYLLLLHLSVAELLSEIPQI